MNKFLVLTILFLTLCIKAFANPNIQARTGILIDHHSNEVNTLQVEEKNISLDFKNDVVNQIKNVTQEKKIKPETQSESKAENKILIATFEQLLNVCSVKKEMKFL